MQCRGLDVYTPIDRVVNRWLGAFQLKRDSVKKRERKKSCCSKVWRSSKEIAVNLTQNVSLRACVCVRAADVFT